MAGVELSGSAAAATGRLEPLTVSYYSIHALFQIVAIRLLFEAHDRLPITLQRGLRFVAPMLSHGFLGL